jgi:hypothetical protein
MSVPDLRQTVTEYLTYEKVASLSKQFETPLTDRFSPNEYYANVQLITWAILEKLKASNDFPVNELTENNVSPIVDSLIKDMCTIDSVEYSLSWADSVPVCVLSRITWWPMKFFGPKLEF